MNLLVATEFVEPKYVSLSLLPVLKNQGLRKPLKMRENHPAKPRMFRLPEAF